MLSCEDSDAKEVPDGKVVVQNNCNDVVQGVVPKQPKQSSDRSKTLLQATVSDSVLKLRVQSAVLSDTTTKTDCSSDSEIPVANSSGLLGSDDIFGSKSCPIPWNWDIKERKKTEQSKLNDRNGNVLRLKDVKKLRSEREEENLDNIPCVDLTGLASNPDMDVRLFEAFGTKEEENPDLSSPMPKGGLSASDYPSGWSKGRIKKAIKARKLAGPPKTKDDTT